MCIFIDDWHCNFAGTEITLEICKTCINARTLHNETKQDKALQKQKMLYDEKVKEKDKDTSKNDNASEEQEEKNFLEVLESKTENLQSKPNIDPYAEQREGSTKKTTISEHLEPRSIIDKKNFEGDVQTLASDPYKETDDWIRAIRENERSLLKIDFPELQGRLDPNKEQEIVIRTRRTEKEFFFPPLPEIRLSLFENDHIITESDRFEIEDTEGEVLTFSWDASDLSNMYGDGLQLIIEAFPSGDDGVMNHVHVGAVRLYAKTIKEEHRKPRIEPRPSKDRSFSALLDEIR